jgi:catechol 2,3-dioxygenase-like lactoylglutathione lyase family enzyme
MSEQAGKTSATALDVERVDFVGVPVRDLARAEEFYGRTLGLERSRGSSERWVEYETSNVTIALISPAALGPKFLEDFRPNWMPIALRVPDVAEARRRLEAAGVEFKGEIIDSGVCHIAVFHDPDGNALQLHRRYAPYPDGTKP